MNNLLVYALLDPNTYKVRYVGQSTVGVDRPKAHMRPSRLFRKDRKNYTHSQRWLQSLHNAEQKPIIEILQYCKDKEDLDSSEVFWIAYFKDRKFDLTNYMSGGQTGGVVKGHKHSPETIEKLKKSAKERYRRDPSSVKKAIAKRVAANTGKKRSKETIAKMVETRNKTGAWNKKPSGFIEATKRKSKPVIDQYGNKYASISEAARTIGSASTAICKQLKGIISHNKGFTFKYL